MFSFLNISDDLHKFVNHTGLEMSLLGECSRRLDFSFDIRNSRDMLWGAIINGTWRGLTGGVVRGDFDIGLTAHLSAEKSKASLNFIPRLKLYGAIIIR